MSNKLDEISFIWDLDGTLFNSYDVIVDSLYIVLKEFNINMDKETIRKEAIIHSVSYLLNKILEQNDNLSFDEVKKRYSKVTEDNNDKITPMYHAKELLEELKKFGVKSYIFTHRGASTDFVLNNTKLNGYFTEIITSKSGFKRKPDPEAINYLVNKYNLNKNKTYYVGDRSLDIECAYNAGIKSILYLPVGGYTSPTGKETYIVSDLLDILKIEQII